MNKNDITRTLYEFSLLPRQSICFQVLIVLHSLDSKNTNEPFIYDDSRFFSIPDIHSFFIYNIKTINNISSVLTVLFKSGYINKLVIDKETQSLITDSNYMRNSVEIYYQIANKSKVLFRFYIR